MEGSYLDCYSFAAEWYDSQASLLRRYTLTYYPTDDTLEMFDLKSRKMFVRRTKVDGVTLDKFYIGCTLHIFGRLIKIVDFGCEDTKKRLQQDYLVTCVVIKPLPNTIAGKIITHLNKHNLQITRMKRVKWTLDDIAFIYRNFTGDSSYPFLLEHFGGNYSFVLEIVGKNIYENIQKIVGHRDPLKAEPGTIRALYGTDIVRNCVHTSKNEEIAREDLAYVFPPPSARASHLRLTATLSNCTLCIVKPHAIREGKLGGIISAIDEAGFNITALNMLVVENINAAEFFEVYKGIVPEYKGKLGGIISAIDEAGFNITALNMLVVENINAAEFFEVYKGIVPEYKVICLLFLKLRNPRGQAGRIISAIDKAGFNITALNMLVVENINAAEFFEVYKGIVPEYKGMVEELASGACVAMELVAKDKSVSSAVEFRKWVGPADPEIARLLRPHTLRAKFGTNKVKNAVHCSDLPEDGLLEVEYFFKILDLAVLTFCDKDFHLRLGLSSTHIFHASRKLEDKYT
ncbi:nucleoside diphosphate kinase domain-containing protein [Phthorimaea operculella]|nr:nucleoside diphosphate kinase domain-containing protein [Phthorimaea operculella]